MRAKAWHHRSDAISSIVIFAGIAGTMAGLPSLDALAAALVSLMIAQIAWTLGWSAVNELVDTGFDPERHQNIRTPSSPLGGAAVSICYVPAALAETHPWTCTSWRMLSQAYPRVP